MYEAHWNLNAKPFEPLFSSDFYYPSESHQTALLKLRYAIENRRALAVLGAASGYGKSLLLHLLRTQLPEFVSPIVQVTYPAFSADDFVRYFAKQLAGNDKSSIATAVDAIDIIETRMRENAESGSHMLLIIEEAEWLENRGVLDVLRLLLNFGTAHSKAESGLTIILSGQPVLVGQIERYPALEQRLAVRCLLNNYDIEETIAYISHRIRQAGGQAERIFRGDAFDAIYHLSGGVPRRINSICDLALMVGYAQDQTTIGPSLIETIQRELSTVA